MCSTAKKKKKLPEHCLRITKKSDAAAVAIRKICLRWVFTTHTNVEFHHKVTIIIYNVICEPFKDMAEGYGTELADKFGESFYGIL
jgi:hypothetical protein